eukprot:2079384-Amphidinium_carterae.1
MQISQCGMQEGYKTAVQEVEDLLTRIYEDAAAPCSAPVLDSLRNLSGDLVAHEDYRNYCRENNLPVPNLQINFSENQLVYSSRGGPAESQAY